MFSRERKGVSKQQPRKRTGGSKPGPPQEKAAPAAPKRRRARNLERLIEELIRELRQRLADPKEREQGFHAVVADLTKILQLKKELTPERPKEVTVRWVEEEKEKEEA